MPIIKKEVIEFTKKNLQIEKKILDEVEDYCTHFNVSFEKFVNQALEFVLQKDADWKQEKANRKKAS